MEIRQLDMDKNQKERITYRNRMFPYGLYVPRDEPHFFYDIPWHWHDEFEFGFIKGGSMLYRTSRHEFVLREGDGIFINSGVLHYLHPLEPVKKVRLQSQFFDKSFLAGASGSFLDLKYVTPVQEQKLLDAVPLYQKDAESRRFLARMNEAAHLVTDGSLFCELRLRSIFSELWETVYSWAKGKGTEQSGYEKEDERIKQMMLYIQEHYPEKISVAEIAGQIPVSERECYRLFQNSLSMTPMEYVMVYRLQRAQELLANTGRSILEIAVETGFGTSSYFGKQFRQYYQLTPGQYRSTVKKL